MERYSHPVSLQVGRAACSPAAPGPPNRGPSRVRSASLSRVCLPQKLRPSLVTLSEVRCPCVGEKPSWGALTSSLYAVFRVRVTDGGILSTPGTGGRPHSHIHGTFSMPCSGPRILL